MPGTEELFEDLRAMKKEGENEKIEWAAVRKEWLEDLENLMTQIRGWLDAGEKEGLLRIEKNTVTMEEEKIGTYQAPALKIRFPGSRIVQVEPAGRLIVGAKGRVDFTHGPRKTILLRREHESWQFRIGAGGMSGEKFHDLSEESLSEAIRELIA